MTVSLTPASQAQAALALVAARFTNHDRLARTVTVTSHYNDLPRQGAQCRDSAAACEPGQDAAAVTQ